MNKSNITALFAAVLWLAHTPAAFCSDVTGEVSGPNGPVAGAQVTVADSGGNVVGQGTTNDAGQYCIRGITPGEYKTALNPPSGAGLQPGVVNRTVPNEGLTENWAVSPATVAASSANSPGACEAWYAGAGVPIIGAAALLVATGAGLGICAAAGACFNDDGHPATASK
jgi:Carboxypeptidase regulatory-like domain